LTNVLLHSLQGTGCPFKKGFGCSLLTKDTTCPYLKKGDGCTLKAKALAAGCPFFKKDLGCPFFFKGDGCPLKKSVNVLILSR
jgi:hypothetical protein